MRAGVDQELDNMKRAYDGIEDLLDQTSRNIAELAPPQYSVDLNVIFFPQIGFLISVPISQHADGQLYEGNGAGAEDWDHMFSTGSRVYYKDYRMRQLDETFGDMYAMICGKLGFLWYIRKRSRLIRYCRQGN